MRRRRTNVVLAGVGGQGILLASEVVARAAMAGGYQVKTNEVHGMAQRGGSVIAQIRYGEEVHSPLVAVGTGNVLGSFEKIEAVRYAHYLAPEGLAVVSTMEMVPVTVSSGQAKYPPNADELLKEAFPRLTLVDAVHEAEKAGEVRAANLVILGVVSTELDLSVENWYDAIRGTVKPRFIDVNIRAFDLGRSIV